MRLKSSLRGDSSASSGSKRVSFSGHDEVFRDETDYIDIFSDETDLAEQYYDAEVGLHGLPEISENVELYERDNSLQIDDLLREQPLDQYMDFDDVNAELPTQSRRDLHFGDTSLMSLPDITESTVDYDDDDDSLDLGNLLEGQPDEEVVGKRDNDDDDLSTTSTEKSRLSLWLRILGLAATCGTVLTFGWFCTRQRADEDDVAAVVPRKELNAKADLSVADGGGGHDAGDASGQKSTSQGSATLP
jgi:hypothetical protein